MLHFSILMLSLSAEEPQSTGPAIQVPPETYVPRMRLDVAPSMFARITPLNTATLTVPGIGLWLAGQLTRDFSLGLSLDLASQLECGKRATCASLGLVSIEGRYTLIDYSGLMIFLVADVGLAQFGQRTENIDDSVSGLASRVGMGLSRRTTFKNLRIALVIRYGHVFASPSTPGVPRWDFVQFSLPLQTFF